MRRFAMMVLAAALGSATAVAVRPAEAVPASVRPHAPVAATLHEVRYDSHWRDHRRAHEQARLAAARREARRIERERAARRARHHAWQRHHDHHRHW